MRYLLRSLAVVLACLVCAWAPAKEQGKTKTAEGAALSGHHETVGDAYVPVPLENQPTSPAYRGSGPGFYVTQVNVNGAGQNIVGDAGNEPSIAVDPTNPNRMCIGWRQFDTISSDFRQAGNAYSINGGQSWIAREVIDPGVFRSDPVLDADASGTFYYNSLTVAGSDFYCDVYKSSDGGATWDAGIFAQGGDKQWMALDRTGGMGDGHIYAFWTVYYSTCSGMFTRSINGGASYETCVGVSGSPYWGTLTVGPEGNLYVAGDGFIVAKSSNARDAGQTVSWDFSRNVSLGGSIGSGGGPNPGGLLGQAWIATDHSSGPNNGNVYLLASVSPSGSPDPMDVRFCRSTDGGSSWSDSVRVNDDPGTGDYQWMGTMAVAPNGRIDAVWLDTRDGPGAYDSSLYYSWSDDTGVTWADNIRITDSFDPHVGWPQQNKMGDYFHMVSLNDAAHLAFAGTMNGEQDVYYARFTHGGTPPAGSFLVTGPGAAQSNPPLVRVFPPEQSASHAVEFSAYGASSYGANVTTGDINGDGSDSIITGAGPGAIYGPHVRGFSPAGTAIPELNFLAYGTNKFGVNVVCGDLTGNGRDEIITGAGPGAVFGPHVRAFANTGTAMEPMAGVSYFAYGTPKWGVNVAAGDIDGDGNDEIVTGPGPGNIYGPHVRGWNVDGGTVAPIPGVSYFAYGTNKKGVRVACGDVDGDGIDEIITGPGPSGVFGAHVRGWNYDGATLEDIPGINFFAWPSSESLFGATVSANVDLNDDGRNEIITGQGPDPSAGTPLRVFSYDGSQTSLLFDLDAYGDTGLTHGVTAAAGNN
jgi:hypothetical protein